MMVKELIFPVAKVFAVVGAVGGANVLLLLEVFTVWMWRDKNVDVAAMYDLLEARFLCSRGRHDGR